MKASVISSFTMNASANFSNRSLVSASFSQERTHGGGFTNCLGVIEAEFCEARAAKMANGLANAARKRVVRMLNRFRGERSDRNWLVESKDHGDDGLGMEQCENMASYISPLSHPHPTRFIP